MGISSPFKDQTHPYTLFKKLLPYALYALFPIALLRLYLHPPSLPQSPIDPLPNVNPIIFPSSSSSFLHLLLMKRKAPTKFHATTQMANGSVTSWVLCTMAQAVAQSRMARTASAMAGLIWVTSIGGGSPINASFPDNKFRRWHFPSHNISVSIHWSPFLVRGIEKSNSGPNYNKLYLDYVDERWAGDMDRMDMIVLSIGHWFLHPAVFYEGDSVLGCHYCPGLNHTEVGFYEVFGKAFRTTLKTIAERRGANGNPIDVIVTTFSPSHFEGDWDKAGACPKTRPFKEGEKLLEGMDADMRRVEVEEVEAAKANTEQFPGFRVEALDVTKLSLMRPDGHPGPYMHPFPFANGSRTESRTIVSIGACQGP
ncbi:Protein altered xyloglucan 4 [Vitis vinifera]|uniref:Protein altered xyloglucan 4 n=1 Tax=Vitis vinifera TaxID=29760 RepID=A0A438EHH1_VITVI|nr:Protein altered xyloglucan 4 [Vitis vinifera]